MSGSSVFPIEDLRDPFAGQINAAGVCRPDQWEIDPPLRGGRWHGRLRAGHGDRGSLRQRWPTVEDDNTIPDMTTNDHAVIVSWRTAGIKIEVGRGNGPEVTQSPFWPNRVSREWPRSKRQPSGFP
jgi:hypothetical protein